MRIVWLNKKNRDRVIIFFNGWGMDENAVIRLSGIYDLLMVYDYRHLENKNFPVLEEYQEIFVVAWSMGVWAASNVIPELPFSPSRLIALNGTEHPVDDHWGIPCRSYQLTEKGMDEKGRKKFIQRMLADSQEIQRLGENYSQRLLAEVCEELVCIRQQSTRMHNRLDWDKVYISEKDIIFPVKNQLNYWQGRCANIYNLSGGHYPFYQFQRWEEIIEGQKF